MAKENFTKFGNELLTALYRPSFTLRETRTILCIIRHTVGYHQKSWHTTNSTIAAMTGISDADMSRVLKSLAKRRIISRSGSAKFKVAISINPVEMWEIDEPKNQTSEKPIVDAPTVKHVSAESPPVGGSPQTEKPTSYLATLRPQTRKTQQAPKPPESPKPVELPAIEGWDEVEID